VLSMSGGKALFESVAISNSTASVCVAGRPIGSEAEAEWGGCVQSGGVVMMSGGSVEFKGGSIAGSTAVRDPLGCCTLRSCGLSCGVQHAACVSLPLHVARCFCCICFVA
jgi:hypothetical protein